MQVTPQNDHLETPTWSAKLHILPRWVKEEIYRGDMRQVVEIGRSFWQVVQKGGYLIVGVELQHE